MRAYMYTYTLHVERFLFFRVCETSLAENTAHRHPETRVAHNVTCAISAFHACKHGLTTAKRENPHTTAYVLTTDTDAVGCWVRRRLNKMSARRGGAGVWRDIMNRISQLSERKNYLSRKWFQSIINNKIFVI